MIKGALGALALVAVAIGYVCAESVTPDARFAEVREYVINEVADGKVISISIAVAENGRIIWEEAFGWADVENKVAATPHTPYHLGSISKTVTATSLMTLVEKGLVDLESPISQYLGELKLRAYVGSVEDVTVRHVLNHRAGLPAYCDYFFVGDRQHHRTFDETVHRYGTIHVSPGVAYVYSNLGYQLLGYLVSNVAGVGFPEYVRDHVFLPLGMNAAAIYDGTIPVDGAAVFYTPSGERIPRYSGGYPGTADAYCSVHDLIRFAMFHLKNRRPDQQSILRDESIDRMQESYSPGNTTYGIGWYFDLNELGYRSVYHGGEGPGTDNFLRLIPSENIAVAILCNTEFAGLGELQETVCTVLIPEFEKMNKGEASSDDQSPRLPEELLGKWTGKLVTYEGEIAVEMEIKAKHGATIRLAGQHASDISLIIVTDTFLFGDFSGRIPTPDSGRYPGNVRIALVKRGSVLSGTATAVGWLEERQASYELSSWLEVGKSK
jgi:CubicO group peptidase (beta-lactamase class C family)